MASEFTTFARNAGKLRAQADRDRSLSFGARLLLGHLLRYARRTGVAFPSRNTLADLMGRSVRRIADYLRELRERGFLRWVRTRRASNVYAFGFDRVDAQAAPLSEGQWNDHPYHFAGGRFRQVILDAVRRCGPFIKASQAPPGRSEQSEAKALVGPSVADKPGDLARLAALPMPKASAALLATLGRRA